MIEADKQGLLETEREVKEMPKGQRDWFFGKSGHSDCFIVAKAGWNKRFNESNEYSGDGEKK